MIDPKIGRAYKTVHQTAAVACLASSRKAEAKLALEWLGDFFTQPHGTIS